MLHLLITTSLTNRNLIIVSRINSMKIESNIPSALLPFLYVVSALVFLLYAELNYLHWVTPNEPSFVGLGGMLALVLPLPLFAVLLHAVKLIENHVNKNPIFITIGPNMINATYNQSISESIKGSFSDGSKILADNIEFEKSISILIRNVARAAGLRLSPCVVLKNCQQMSKVELDAAKLAISNAGALRAVVC